MQGFIEFLILYASDDSGELSRRGSSKVGRIFLIKIFIENLKNTFELPTSLLQLPLAPAPITASDFILLFPHRLLDTLNSHNEISQREVQFRFVLSRFKLYFLSTNTTDCVEIGDVMC